MFDPLLEAMATVLSFFYDTTGGSYGLAIILLTLAVMTVLTPLTIRGTKSMMAMQEHQPELKRIQERNKGAENRQQASEEMMAYYREHNINPVGSCLPLLAQMPVFLILYQVVRGVTATGSDGTFAPKFLAEGSAMRTALEGTREMLFLGIDLEPSAQQVLSDNFVGALPYLLLIAVVAVTSYIQQKQVSGRNPTSQMNPQQRMLLRVMPVFFAFISFTFPAALVLYFLTSNLFRVGQQAYISKKLYGVNASLFGKASTKSDVGTSIEAAKDSGGSSSGGLMDKLRAMQDGTPSVDEGSDKPSGSKSSAKKPEPKTNGPTKGAAKSKGSGPPKGAKRPSGSANKNGAAATGSAGVEPRPRRKKRK